METYAAVPGFLYLGAIALTRPCLFRRDQQHGPVRRSEQPPRGLRAGSEYPATAFRTLTALQPSSAVEEPALRERHDWRLEPFHHDPDPGRQAGGPWLHEHQQCVW